MKSVLANSVDGAWREATFSPSFSLLVGDIVRQDGSQVIQMRGGIVIATATITSVETVVPDAPSDFSGAVSKVTFFRRDHVNGISTAMTGSTIDEDGNITISYGDDTQVQTTLTDLTQEANDLDQDIALAKRLCRIKLVRDQPTLADPHALDGMSVAINSQSAQPVIITLP